MAKGGNQVQKSEVTQSNLPEYARPYFEGMMSRANTAMTQPFQRYVNAEGQPIGRIAGFTEQQQDLQKNILGMQTPGQFGTASGLASIAGQRALDMDAYTPGKFGYDKVAAQGVNAQDMQAAQSGYNPNLQYFQMAGPERFGGRQAAQYMSPFIRQALEPQMREAVYSARRGQLAQDLGAARQGTYGGSRQLLASMERERNLGQQMGDIYGRGMQSAYESAQSQFERDRAAQQQAQQANLQAALGVQQLGTQTGLSVAMANLSNEQQARVNNQALQFQAQGMNAENALRAALANQQASLEAQRMGEQSRQFGAQQGLAALAQAGQMGQTMANIGTAQSQADQARFGLQQSTAAQEQALNQQKLDMAYQDFLRERDYPMEQLQQYSSLLRGVPVAPSSTTTTYAPSPSVANQLLSTGLGGLSMYNMASKAGVI